MLLIPVDPSYKFLGTNCNLDLENCQPMLISTYVNK